MPIAIMATDSTTGRPTKRPEKRATHDPAKDEAEVRAIMRSAYRLIGRNEPTSVQDILAEAGLSTRAFYRHFASKDDLIVAMYRADSQRVASELAEAITSAPTPARAVEAWIDHWLAIAYDPRRAGHVRVLSSAEARSAVGLRAVEAEQHKTSVTMLAQVLSAGRHDGSFPLVEPDDDARAFQAVVVALLHARIDREFTPARTAARVHLCSLIGRAVGCRLGGP
jgi:AcrR family transcriptional regulator